MSNHNTIQQQQQQQQKQSNQQQSALQKRQEQFDEFMAFFSSPEMFGTELFNLYSMDASEEATRLLADCIEANWIIFGGGGDDASAIKQKMLMTNLKELSSTRTKEEGKPSQD
jgi:hypothetical protein